MDLTVGLGASGTNVDTVTGDQAQECRGHLGLPRVVDAHEQHRGCSGQGSSCGGPTGRSATIWWADYEQHPPAGALDESLQHEVVVALRVWAAAIRPACTIRLAGIVSKVRPS